MEAEQEKTWPPDGDRLMSTEETAYRLDTSTARVNELINTGVLPCIRFGRIRKVRKVRLDEFIAKLEGQDLLEVLGKVVAG